MSEASPIKIKEIKKKGVLDEDRFYSLLATHCNYIDKETLKVFYMGLVRHITKELRENGVVKLPHIGYFALVRTKVKNLWIGGKYSPPPEGRMYSLRYMPNLIWKKYFVHLSRRPGKEGCLDPREKLLGENLDDEIGGDNNLNNLS